MTPAQELVLVEWAETMGRRGMPLNAQAIIDYASDVAGISVESSWVKRFKLHHPDLRVKWTQNLEQCRARALNRTTVREFFDLLRKLVVEYSIPMENIYNMDEKGIQLSIGACIAVFIDRDQASVYNIEHGNCKLITVIESVYADGSSLRPSVIYQGVHCDFEWS